MVRRNYIYKWLYSIDGVSLVLMLILMSIGVLLITSASPSMGDRLHIHPFHFAHRQFIFVAVACLLMVLLSLPSERILKILIPVLFILIIFALFLLLIFGNEVKGAKRWINIGSFALQPSEFLKPAYITVCALILAWGQKKTSTFLTVMLLHAFILLLLVLQPDIGMSLSLSVVVIIQLFLAGLPILWLFMLAILGFVSISVAYLLLPHVAYRINNFLKPELGNYQVEKALQAYAKGGYFGRGPGEGVIKNYIPDSHTDFIFAIAGEELGTLFCILIILLYFCLIARGTYQLLKIDNVFRMYAISGIILNLALQVLLNIGITLGLFPTKGMTLPFISYGGSSTLAIGISMGIYLNLTRKKGVTFGALKQKSYKYIQSI